MIKKQMYDYFKSHLAQLTPSIAPFITLSAPVHNMFVELPFQESNKLESQIFRLQS